VYSKVNLLVRSHFQAQKAAPIFLKRKKEWCVYVCSLIGRSSIYFFVSQFCRRRETEQKRKKERLSEQVSEWVSEWVREREREREREIRCGTAPVLLSSWTGRAPRQREPGVPNGYRVTCVYIGWAHIQRREHTQALLSLSLSPSFFLSLSLYTFK
jgi:hypothetical protein